MTFLYSGIVRTPSKSLSPSISSYQSLFRVTALQAVEPMLNVDDEEGYLHYNAACYAAFAANTKVRVMYLDGELDKFGHGYLKKLEPYKDAWHLLEAADTPNRQYPTVLH